MLTIDDRRSDDRPFAAYPKSFRKRCPNRAVSTMASRPGQRFRPQDTSAQAPLGSRHGMGKPPPPDAARKQIMAMNEATMPGDIGFMATLGTGEGEHIWNRMAMVIRKHSLDVRLLMDAHDRRNRGFVDVQTFRRSLCYAFGNQWIELGMSTAEFNEICEPYRSRLPHAKGEPDAFIMWQKFAADLQCLANTRRPSQNFLAKLEEVERKEKVDLELQAKWGMDVFTLTSALSAIKDRLLTYNTSINKAFQRIDLDNSGSVSQPVGKVESESAVLVRPQLVPLACLGEISSLRCALGTSRRAAQGICSAAARPGRCRRIQQRSIHTQVNVKEMLHCFKDAHIEHIVNENTLNLIMGYCDKTGDGETNCNELTLLCTYCIPTRLPLAYYAQARSTTMSWLPSS
jgi:hypothetical protein